MGMPTGTIIAKDIKTRIEEGGRNRIYAVSDFADLDNDAAVNRILSRMNGNGMLVRLAQGLYLYPNVTRFGTQMPSIDVIAKTIAEKECAMIIPSGLSALNALGLSTQVPMNAVYVTNGTPRKLKVGNRCVTFKRGCPRLFSYRSRLFALVVMAMKEIGEKHISENEVVHLAKLLRESDDSDAIRQDMLTAPSWIRKKLSVR